MLREIVLDTETTGTDHGKRRPGHRDRLRRAAQPHPDGQDLSRLHQPGTPGLARRFRGARALATSSWPTSRSSPRLRTSSRISSATPGSSSTMRPSTSASSMRNSPAPGTAPIVLDRCGRHPVAGAAQASGRAEQPRCAVHALRHRQFPAHQARRASRRRDPGRSLYRADRRQAGRPRPVAPPRARRSAAASERARPRSPGDAAAPHSCRA